MEPESINYDAGISDQIKKENIDFVQLYPESVAEGKKDDRSGNYRMPVDVLLQVVKAYSRFIRISKEPF